jgi:hypothetical protein
MSLKPVSSQRDYGFHRAGFREEVGGAGHDLHCFLTSQSGVSAFVELDHSGISPAKRPEPNTVPLCLRKKAIFIFKSETSSDLRAFSDDQGGHKLPAQFRPWHAIGVVRPESVPPQVECQSFLDNLIAQFGTLSLGMIRWSQTLGVPFCPLMT